MHAYAYASWPKDGSLIDEWSSLLSAMSHAIGTDRKLHYDNRLTNMDVQNNQCLHFLKWGSAVSLLAMTFFGMKHEQWASMIGAIISAFTQTNHRLIKKLEAMEMLCCFHLEFGFNSLFARNREYTGSARVHQVYDSTMHGWSQRTTFMQRMNTTLVLYNIHD